MDNIFIRLAIVCLLGLLGFEAFRELKKPEKETYIELHEPQLKADGKLEEGEHMPDSMVPSGKVKNPIKILTFFIILAAGVGFVTVKWVLPALGDAVSAAAFSAGAKADESPYVKATELTMAGRYKEAVAEFKHQLEKHPADRYPLMELVKIQLGKLNDIDGAMETLHHAVNQEWEEKDGAFFAQRLADLYHDEKGDNAMAKQLLNSIVSKYPGSVAAGNATNRVREIEEAEFIASRNQS